MGKNRQRNRNNHLQDGDENPSLVENIPSRNERPRNPPRMPPSNHFPSMHPNHNPFRNQSVTHPPLNSNNRNPFRQNHRPPYTPPIRGRDARTQNKMNNGILQRQLNLKKHIVQTLNQAVHTIELWLPDTNITSSGSDAESWSETDTDDEMDWQLEKEVEIPQPSEVIYPWDIVPNVTFQWPDAGSATKLGQFSYLGEGEDGWRYGLRSYIRSGVLDQKRDSSMSDDVLES